jgi:hypothetical protein
VAAGVLRGTQGGFAAGSPIARGPLSALLSFFSNDPVFHLTCRNCRLDTLRISGFLVLSVS